MELTFDNIVDKHNGEECFIALHGPSMSPYIKKVQELQRTRGLKRISVNQWYDYFNEKPDYWVVSNTEYSIYNSIAPNFFWDEYNKGWPKNVFNKYNVPLFFNDTADLTPYDFIENNLKCDYLPYDSKHFKNRSCKEILLSFKKYWEENRDFNFAEYGNNTEMWQKLSTEGTSCDTSWATFASGWSRNVKCCHRRREDRLTIQEKLQSYSGADQHAGVGTSVGMFAIMFAVLMGFKKIYVAGYDMDYGLGYANPEATGYQHHINLGAIGHWKVIHRNTILNDLTIINNSAKLVGSEIINLNTNSWFDTLTIGELK